MIPLSAGPAGFSAAMLALLLDPVALARLRAAGLNRSPRFAWDRAAETIAAAYG